MLPITLALAVSLPAPLPAYFTINSTPPTYCGGVPQELNLPARGERAPRRILHLSDGRVLRVAARQVQAGGHGDGSPEGADPIWEIRQGKDWLALPASYIVRVADESDVLRQARKLESALEREDWLRRTAYADWLVHAGLHVEALQQIDRVLDAIPDQPDAHALLERTKFRVALPPIDSSSLVPEVRTFLETVAQARPAVREIAIEKLRDLGEMPALQSELLSQLVSHNPRRRSMATLALRRLVPGQHTKNLLQRALLDTSREVRLGASLALRDGGNGDALDTVVRALASDNSTLRAHSIHALRVMHTPVAVAPLYQRLATARPAPTRTRAPHSNLFIGTQSAFVQDFGVEVASSAGIANPSINVLTEGVVLDVTILSTTSSTLVAGEGDAIRRALSQLTGANPGNTTAAWKRWWKENGADWQVKKTSPFIQSASTSRGS